MKISEIDKNFAVKSAETLINTQFVIPQEPIKLYGVIYDKDFDGFLRMPLDAAKNVSEGVEYLCQHTAGGRIRFGTDSKKMHVTVKMKTLSIMSHMAIAGSSGFALTEQTENGDELRSMIRPEATDTSEYSRTVTLKGEKIRNYTMYFPLYNDVSSLSFSFDDGATVTSGKEYENIKPILYYGSSITQGGCASRPDNCYQGLIAKWTNVDYLNLGFSGSGIAEDAMIEYLSNIDCSIFVCDYDHNAPNAEHLRATHPKLYREFRAKHPETPIIFLTKPDWKSDCSSQERMEVIRSTYENARQNGDKNVYFISGKELYGEDYENFSVDTCHPSDSGFYFFAKRLYKDIEPLISTAKQK